MPTRFFAVAALFVLTACSQQPAALKAAAKNLGAGQIGTIEVCANGRSFAHAEGGRAAVYDVSDFTASVDYFESASRVRMTRRQRFDPGTLQPFPEEQQSERFVADGYAWDVHPSVSAVAGAIPTTHVHQSEMQERLAEIWMYPQGFLRAAMKYKAKATPTDEGTELSFETQGTRYLGTVDKNDDLIRVQAWITAADRTPTHLDTVYSEYRDYHGVRFPRHIVRNRNGERDLELTVCSLRTGSAFQIFVPKAVEVTAKAERDQGIAGSG